MVLSAFSHSSLRRPSSSSQKSQHTKEEQEELAFGQVWKDAGSRSKENHASVQRPSLLNDGRRKSSVQFNTGPAEETIRRESTAAPIRGSIPHSPSHAGRDHSPPPPMPFTRGIAFDTFKTPDAPAEAFSIQYKHQDFAYTPRTRTFIVGTDAKDYSEYALEWTLDELVDDGDEIVCLRVVSEDSSERRNYKEEADRLLDSVVQKNVIERKAICLKMELAVGKVTDVIQSMIQLYEPVAIIVGTRGRALTGVQGLRGGSSVSKYCLQRSPVPTIVVRPSSKRTKKKMKRQQEISRSVYSNMLSRAQNVRSSSVFDKNVDSTFERRASAQEADAVEEAVGHPRIPGGILKNRSYGGSLARVTSAQTEDSDDEPAAPSFALPIGYLSTESAPTAEAAMKTPLLQALGEDWDDSPKSGSRAHSPAPHSMSTSAKAPSEGALTDTEEDDEGHPTIIEHRRPSTRSQTPWLNAILAKPEKTPAGLTARRAESIDRRGQSRSRSR